MSSSRLVETPFRSPQLALFDVGPGKWVLYWRTPDYAPARRKRRVPGIVQPLLFDFEEMVVGAHETSFATQPRGHLQLIEKPAETE